MTRRRRLAGWVALVSLGALAAPLTAPSGASATPTSIATTGRASVTTAGAQANDGVNGSHVEISNDGRFVAFTSESALVPDDTNGSDDVYVRDRFGSTTTRVSLTDADGQIGGPSQLCGMSRNGRYVAFLAFGTGLTQSGYPQIYLRDRTARTTEIVSVSTSGDPADANGNESGIFIDDPCPVSDSGRYVAFVSEADNLAGGDANGTGPDVFRRDLLTDSTQRVSLSHVGLGGNGKSWWPAMSADGTTVAFASSATNLVANDTNGDEDVFVRAVDAAQTTRVSVTSGGVQLNDPSTSPAITADGNQVAFLSSSPTLTVGDANGRDDVFIRNRSASTVVRASVGLDGGAIPANAVLPDIASDGSAVTWSMRIPTVVPGDANTDDDVYHRVLSASSAQVASATTAPGGGAGNGQSYEHALSGDGTKVAMISRASNLARNDTNGDADAYVRDLRLVITPFSSTTAFIAQQYADFEGRSPTSAESTEWRARIINGERHPDELIDELARGATWSSKRAPLARLYWAFFLRPPDTGGMNYWTNQLTNGRTLAQVAAQFATSSEFATAYGSLGSSAFVTKIYQNIFERNPDPGGLAFWTKQLDTKKRTRGEVMVSFSESSEGRRRLAPQTDAVLIRLGMLRTMPSKATLLDQKAKRGAGDVAEQYASSLRPLPTYAARITP